MIQECYASKCNDLSRQMGRIFVVRLRRVQAMRLTSVLALVTLLPSAALAQEPDTVTLADLTIAGVRYDSDTTGTRAKLGAPLQIRRADRPNSDGVVLTTWYYPNLILSFAPDDHRYTAIVQGPRYRTTRGIVIGDSLAKVRRLYGRPLAEVYGSELVYASSTKLTTLGITFYIKGGRVSEIMLGKVISVD